MQPTPEQSDAVDLFGSGLGLAIEAGAGTGKTTTLQLLGESTTRRGAYMAFNRSIVEEAKRKMPDNVGANRRRAPGGTSAVRAGDDNPGVGTPSRPPSPDTMATEMTDAPAIDIGSVRS